MNNPIFYGKPTRHHFKLQLVGVAKFRRLANKLRKDDFGQAVS